jgi:hypothetical protein
MNTIKVITQKDGMQNSSSILIKQAKSFFSVNWFCETHNENDYYLQT